MKNFIYLFIIAIVLFFFLSEVYRENFQINNACKLAETANTNTINDCIRKCLNGRGCIRTKENIKRCQELCIDCIDHENPDSTNTEEKKLTRCPWLKDIKIQNKSIPNPPNIRAFPGESKILIEWVRPFDGNIPITNYIITLVETYDKKNGIYVVSSSNPKCDICEQEVKGLKGQVYYDVYVNAVNSQGFSKKSNIETILTLGKNNQDSIKNLFNDEEDTYDNIFDDSFNYSCNSKNVGNHSLDNLDKQSINLQKSIINLNNQK